MVYTDGNNDGGVYCYYDIKLCGSRQYCAVDPPCRGTDGNREF